MLCSRSAALASRSATCARKKGVSHRHPSRSTEIGIVADRVDEGVDEEVAFNATNSLSTRRARFHHDEGAFTTTSLTQRDEVAFHTLGSNSTSSTSADEHR